MFTTYLYAASKDTQTGIERTAVDEAGWKDKKQSDSGGCEKDMYPKSAHFHELKAHMSFIKILVE